MVKKKVKEAGQNTLNVIASMMKPWTKEDFEAEVNKRKAQKMAKRNDEMSMVEQYLEFMQKADEIRPRLSEELEDELNAVLEKYDRLKVPFPQALVDRVMDQYTLPAKQNLQAPVRTRTANQGEKIARTCKICGKTGHNARTCPERPAGAPVVTVGDPKLVKKADQDEVRA